MSFRMVDAAMWADPRVRGVSLAARGVLAFLMGGPTRTALPGLVAVGPAGLAEALAVPPSAALEALNELVDAGLAEVDASAPLVRVIDGPKWDSPPAAKIVRSWKRLLSDLPPSPLVDRHRLVLRATAAATCPLDVLSDVLGRDMQAAPSESVGIDTLPEGYRDPTDTQSQVGPRARAASSSSSVSSSSSATASGEQQSPESQTKISCPVPLPVDADTLAALEVNVAMPREVAVVYFRTWAITQATNRDEVRPPAAWIKCAVIAAQMSWSDPAKRKGMVAAAKAAVEDPGELERRRLRKQAAMEAELTAQHERDEAALRERIAAGAGPAKVTTPADLERAVATIGGRRG